MWGCHGVRELIPNVDALGHGSLRQRWSRASRSWMLRWRWKRCAFEAEQKWKTMENKRKAETEICDSWNSQSFSRSRSTAIVDANGLGAVAEFAMKRCRRPNTPDLITLALPAIGPNSRWRNSLLFSPLPAQVHSWFQTEFVNQRYFATRSGDRF